jgi:CRP-like cAMP-binding protein
MGDFLDEKRREIEARLKELRPLVVEYERLQAAAAVLAGVAAPPGPRRPRAQQALDLLRERPGLTIAEMAEAMGINQNYLYRVLPTLQREGLVSKRDHSWYPAPGRRGADHEALAP